jgi:hypothetical protein
LAAILIACLGAAAESLESALRAANVPVGSFAASELSKQITSYAASKGGPFLFAYYVSDGSNELKPPLHVIRFDRRMGRLQRSSVRNIDALSRGSERMNCLGAADRIFEHGGSIFVETHLSPSAVCVIVLGGDLTYKDRLSGWVLGFIGSDYVILHRSEVHFAAVHPMRIEIIDLARSRTEQVFPPAGDAFRLEYSRLLKPHIVEDWCRINNAECDPGNFDTALVGKVAVNEAAKVFGFEAEFDADGFGEVAVKRVPARRVVYIYRAQGQIWDYRAFEPSQLRARFGVSTVDELVGQKPHAPFTMPK